MKLLGVIQCWIIHVFGGKHLFRYTEGKTVKPCRRCGFVKPVIRRTLIGTKP